MSSIVEIGGQIVGGGGFVFTLPGSSSFYALPAGRTTMWAPGITGCPTSGSLAPFAPPVGWTGGIPLALYKQSGATISPSGGDDAAAINTALTTAGASATATNPKYVKLSVGQFLINSTDIKIPNSYVALIGSGQGPGMTGALATLPSSATATVLVRIAGSSNPVVLIGTLLGSGAGTLNTMTATSSFTTDAVGGTSTITLTSPGSLTGLVAGKFVYVDEQFDPALVWYNEAGNSQPSGYKGWGENGNSATDAASRPVGQMMEVQSYNASTGVISFTTPFAKTYRLSFGAHLGILALSSQVIWSGVSNLFMSGGGGGDGGGDVVFGNAGYCWAVQVEAAGHTGTFGGGCLHVSNSFRCEFRDSYFHSVSADITNISPGGGYYNIVVDSFASDCLLENNISWVGNKVMVMRSAGSGNVVGYNMMDDAYGITYLNQMETGINQDHMAGTHHTLFEGNYSWQLSCDSRWGNQTYATWFRNWATGMRTSAWPSLLIPGGSTAAGNPLIGLTNSGFYYEDGFNRNPIKASSYHWFYNYVGNVLGYPGNPLLTAPQSTGTHVVQTATAYEWFGPSGSTPNTTIPMWAIGSTDSIESNISVTGYVAGGLLTVVSIVTAQPSLIEPGLLVSGSGMPAGQFITGFGVAGIFFPTVGANGTGGVGTYPIVDSSIVIGSAGAPVPFTIGYFGNGLNQTVLPLTLRDANFDYFTGLVHWHGLGGSGNQVTPPGASVSGGSILPPSLYLSSKPGFFGTNTWPCYDGSNASNPLPGQQPAWQRFQSGTPNAILSAPSIRQSGQFVNTSHAAANSNTWNVTLTNVLAGSTIYIVGMWPNFASSYPTMTATDGTNTYTLLDRIDDLANKNNGIQGTQSMGHWYAKNVPAGTYIVNMSPNPITTEDWVATIVMEITGCNAAPLVAHNIGISANVAPGANNISISATNTQGAALAIATCFDDVDFAGPTQPGAGTGYTPVITALWPFFINGTNRNSAMCQTALVAGGSQTATFSANEPATGGQSPNYINTLALFY